MDNNIKIKLIELAKTARRSAYVPYSNFAVGAALLVKSGEVYTGCNIESAAYTPTCCAERVAFFKAISESEHDFEAIAVIGGDKNSNNLDFCPPCGVCRQVMMEFCDPEKFMIILINSINKIKIFSLKELLPLGFGPNNLA